MNDRDRAGTKVLDRMIERREQAELPRRSAAPHLSVVRRRGQTGDMGDWVIDEAE